MLLPLTLLAWVVPASAGRVAPDPSQGRRVLVVANGKDPSSVDLARYYARKRGVPRSNVLLVETTTAEEIDQKEFAERIERPIKAALAKGGDGVDFLLLVRGVPIRIREGGDSVDSVLMAEGLPPFRVNPSIELAKNPYFDAKEPFSHAKYKVRLACRLDGYTVAQARALVDRSLAAKPNRGPFLLDEADNRKSEAFVGLQETLGRAAGLLRSKRLNATLETTPKFVGSATPLAGYASWASNDGSFDPKVYHGLRFLPGAVCETFVSTSGRTFRPTSGGQSLVADLVAQGVTGVKGYVSEPYTFALAHADLLFGHYTEGFNLAESFYAASPVTRWKDVVIGDPLCNPYRK